MTEEMKNRLESVMERILKNAPVDDVCPMADKTVRPKWKCGKNKRGEETFCKCVSGYSKCAHYQKMVLLEFMENDRQRNGKTGIRRKAKEKRSTKENVSILTYTILTIRFEQ